MALYTPPDRNKSPKENETIEEDQGARKNEKTIFYTRPSLGLKLWGPLVPASDNTAGLWSLVALQTALGLFCVKRFKSLRPKVIKRDISDFPSLNRFSKTRGDMYISTHIPTSFGGTHSFHRRVGEKTGFLYTKRYVIFKRFMYFTSAMILLVESLLETSRLLLLKYDPWIEEARSVRDKQFFNDIVTYYHEGIDPAKFKVKDITSGKALSLNIPEVKQSIAVVRAQGQANNLVTKWFGSLDYKPMTFSEFMDRLEFYLNMTDSLHNIKKTKNLNDIVNINKREDELKELTNINRMIRNKMLRLLKNVPRNSIPIMSKKIENSLRGITLSQDHNSPEDIDLGEIWSIYNPWTNLALETSLSIKFLPTVLMPEDVENFEDLKSYSNNKDNSSDNNYD